MRIHRLHVPQHMTARDEPVAVRRARHRIDWHVATALLNEYLDWVEAMLGSVLGAKASSMRADRLSAALTFGPPHQFYVAWRGDEPIGCAGVRMDSDGAELTRVYVPSHARGLGIARRLVNTSLDGARSAGCETIRLDTHPQTMPAAYHLYQELGFQVTGDVEGIEGGVTMCLSLVAAAPSLV